MIAVMLCALMVSETDIMLVNGIPKSFCGDSEKSALVHCSPMMLPGLQSSVFATLLCFASSFPEVTTLPCVWFCSTLHENVDSMFSIECLNTDCLIDAFCEALEMFFLVHSLTSDRICGGLRICLELLLSCGTGLQPVLALRWQRSISTIQSPHVPQTALSVSKLRYL